MLVIEKFVSSFISSRLTILILLNKLTSLSSLIKTHSNIATVNILSEILLNVSSKNEIVIVFMNINKFLCLIND